MLRIMPSICFALCSNMLPQAAPPVFPRQMFEGERMLIKDNNLLDKLRLEGIQPERTLKHDNNLLDKFRLDGIQPQTEITFNIETNKFLNVSTQDESTGKSSNITITNEEGRLPLLRIDCKVSEASEYWKEDEANEPKVLESKDLEIYCCEERNLPNESEFRDKFEDEVSEQNAEATDDIDLLLRDADPSQTPLRDQGRDGGSDYEPRG